MSAPGLARLLLGLLHDLTDRGSAHMETRARLSEISDSKTFWRTLDDTVLDREEYDTVALKVVQHKSFMEIGDLLHIGERTARRRFETALAKIGDNL